MESTTIEGVPVCEESLPEKANSIGESKKKKNDRDGNMLIAGNSLRVHGSSRSFPGKIWMPTNQIRELSVGAHVSREFTCACT